MKPIVGKSLFWGVSLIIIALVALPGAEGHSPLIGNLIWYAGWASFVIGIVLVIGGLINLIPNSQD